MKDKWEYVETEDLWEDGELSRAQVDRKILRGVLITGEFRLIRRTDGKKTISKT